MERSLIEEEGAAAGVPSWARSLTRVIDRLTEGVGYLVLFTFIPMILGGTYEVIARYVFNDPTTWSTDVTFMANGTMFMLGGAYALLKGAHVRTDIFYDKFSDRTKGWIDLITYVVLFLPVMVLIFYISFDGALYSYSIQERSNAGLWQPILWPFRAVVPLTALLLLIQGISELIKSYYTVKTGRMFEHHEKIEV